MRRLTRLFLNAPRKTGSMSKGKKLETETCSLEFNEIKVSGGSVKWRENRTLVKKYRYPVLVCIAWTKTKGEFYKSVQAAKYTPRGIMVGLYLGDVVDKGLVSDGRWCVAIPGYRDTCMLLSSPGGQSVAAKNFSGTTTGCCKESDFGKI